MGFDEMARVEGERGGVAGRYVVAKSDLQAGQQVLYGSEGEWPSAMWWPRGTCRLANRYYTRARQNAT